MSPRRQQSTKSRLRLGALAWGLALVLIACGDAQTHFEQGQAAMTAGDPYKAADEFGRAIEMDPERGELWLWRARALVEQDMTADAVSDLRRAVEVDPTLEEAWRLLGTWEGSPEARLAAFDQALVLNPEDVQVFKTRASVKHDMGDLIGAGDDLEHYLEASPEDKEAWSDLGDVRLAQDLPYDAHRAYQKGNTPASDEPRALHLIKVRAGSGDRLAREYLRDLGEPQEPYLDLAARMYKAGRLQPAMEAARKAVVVHRDDGPERALALAYSAATRAELVHDQMFSGTRGAAGALEQGRVLEEAITECETSIAIEPTALCFRTIGFARLETGKHALAVQALTRALELDSDDHESRWRRALAAAERERWDLVIEDVDYLESVEKASVEALLLRGRAKQHHPDHTIDEAREDLDRAVAMAERGGTTSPFLFPALKARGMHYSETREYKKAWDDLSRARALRTVRDDDIERALAYIESQGGVVSTVP